MCTLDSQARIQSTSGRDCALARCALLVPEERLPLCPPEALGQRRVGAHPAFPARAPPPGQASSRRSSLQARAVHLGLGEGDPKHRENPGRVISVQRQWGAGGRGPGRRPGPFLLIPLAAKPSPVHARFRPGPSIFPGVCPLSLHSSSLWRGSPRTEVPSVLTEPNRTHSKLDSVSLSLSRFKKKKKKSYLYFPGEKRDQRGLMTYSRSHSCKRQSWAWN